MCRIARLFLYPPAPPPAGTTITNRGTNPGGLPIVYWRDPLTLTTTGCSGGAATYFVEMTSELGGAVRSGDMTEGPAGTYTASVAALDPNKGYATVNISLTCPGSPTDYIAFDVYIDPSGTVRKTTGEPVAGAMVTLFRSDSASGPFTAPPAGSALMSLANRDNPDLTDGRGHFGWDVVPGFYRVRAEHEACVSPDDPAQPYTLSAIFEVPPALSDLDLRLFCGLRDSIAPRTTALRAPVPNVNGWNASDVAVTLHAFDEAGGSGVRDVRYMLTSGGTSDTKVVAGDTASVVVAREGTNTLEYFATDNAGNSEAPQRLLVLIDRTPPTVTGTGRPPPNGKGWNNTPVVVRFEAADDVSGIDGAAIFETTVAIEGARQSVSHAFLDLAGNTGSTTVSPIDIDLTAPVTTAIPTPNANANGWWRTSMRLAFSSIDSLSGVATTSFAGSRPLRTRFPFRLRPRGIEGDGEPGRAGERHPGPLARRRALGRRGREGA